MARKIFKQLLSRITPQQKKLSIPFLGPLTADPHLFHLNRHSVSLAFALGIFMALTPLFGGQMVLVALLAFWVRCNLPIALALVWITNPLTISPILFAQYKLGEWVLQSTDTKIPLELSWTWLSEQFSVIWQPLLLGSMLSALFFGAWGYLIVQHFWRWKVIQNWEKRKTRMSVKQH